MLALLWCFSDYLLLKTDNVLPWIIRDRTARTKSDFIIILTVAFLIIFGGIAPAVAITLPKFLKREKLPPIATIVFNTTIALLFFGTLSINMEIINL